MQRRTCEECGADFEGRSSRARFCSAQCRVKSHRRGDAARPVSTPVPAPSEDLVDAVRRALSAAGREGTPAGHLCVLLAEQARDADARALPGLSKELSARLGEALDDASDAVADPIDELERKRAERRGA